eukprot:CAMPEP_0115701686 /NCGR_PEP_ID=MMETSP0272-20121206/68109_1 /TAXON_ID=71861 /ORGANISM="Scrippsiella trochoidea, Strain CCMP3099" /LENGTH=34 /DNA_ID= /DNA_START= /DNA_END= /DNA_ORIENTATION=
MDPTMKAHNPGLKGVNTCSKRPMKLCSSPVKVTK